jgi:hypothetical protein
VHGDLLTICLVLFGAASTILSLIALWSGRRDKATETTEQRVRELARAEYEPLKDRLNDHTTRLTQGGDRFGHIEELFKEHTATLKELTNQVTKMGVKVDLYWNAMEQQAMNMAKTLHQPDPRRRHIDVLLEAFMDGALTEDERIELRKLLLMIRNYEPGGPPLDFPVNPGEQTAASILLSTMDIVSPARMAAMGHAAHRSAAHALGE